MYHTIHGNPMDTKEYKDPDTIVTTIGTDIRKIFPFCLKLDGTGYTRQVGHVVEVRPVLGISKLLAGLLPHPAEGLVYAREHGRAKKLKGAEGNVEAAILKQFKASEDARKAGIAFIAKALLDSQEHVRLLCCTASLNIYA
jgi:hypothetical protein